MKVLVVDDDAHITAFLRSALPAAGFVVDAAASGEEGVRLLRTNEYDLAVLDLNLPDMRGEELVMAARGLNRVPPLLMLTVVSDTASKIRVLNAGADDYLVKPFALEELIARMRALLRRPPGVVPDSLVVGDLEFDARTRTARRAGRELALTPKELALLELLMRSEGAVVSKSALVEHAWDSSANECSNSLDTHMANLRRKLGAPEVIETVHRQGYRIG